MKLNEDMMRKKKIRSNEFFDHSISLKRVKELILENVKVGESLTTGEIMKRINLTRYEQSKIRYVLQSFCIEGKFSAYRDRWHYYTWTRLRSPRNKTKED